MKRDEIAILKAVALCEISQVIGGCVSVCLAIGKRPVSREPVSPVSVPAAS